MSHCVISFCLFFMSNLTCLHIFIILHDLKDHKLSFAKYSSNVLFYEYFSHFVFMFHISNNYVGERNNSFILRVTFICWSSFVMCHFKNCYCLFSVIFLHCIYVVKCAKMELSGRIFPLQPPLQFPSSGHAWEQFRQISCSC